MGGIFIWLSGANRQLLAECPTERPKYFGLGAVIVVTGAMAGVSLAFALVTALGISLRDAAIFAVLWGLAIIMVDRLFVASMHRQRNPLIYIVQALPRLAMSVVLGFVISTPFVLQIFKPEINSEIQQMQAAARATYFKNLPTNPVYVTAQRDQADVDDLSALAASGGSGIDISKDSELANLNNQLTNAQNKLAYWRNDLSCQLYGKGTDGATCTPGYGPLGKDDQSRVNFYSNQVQTLSAEITTRTNALEQQSTQQQDSLKQTYRAQLKTAQQSLAAAQQQLTLQTANVTSGIKQNHGILEQLQALGNVTADNSTLQAARLLLFLLFLFIDTMPVFMKLLINLMPAGTYDTILAGEEALQVRDAEDDRAQRQAARRAARQAEAAGVRARNEAYFAPLPGMTKDIIAARLRVEKQWLQRREEEMMRDVAAGSGITGIGAPRSAARRMHGWPTARPDLASPWTRTPRAPGDPPRRTASRAGGHAGWAEWLAALHLPHLPRRPRPTLRHRAPGPPYEHAPEPGPAAPDRDTAAWDDIRPKRDFGPAPSAFGGDPADLDEPADFLAAPAPMYGGDLASDDYDGPGAGDVDGDY